MADRRGQEIHHQPPPHGHGQRHRSSHVGIRDPRNADDLEPYERTKELGCHVVYLLKKISLI